MKYWYLKGGDVLGPLTAQEIVSDGDFTPESLVCPEPQSADETYWKTPDKYGADFASFLPTPAVPADLATQPKSAPEQYTKKEDTIPVRSAEDAAILEEASRIEEISPEETIHTSNPIIAAKEDNLLADIPAAGLLGPVAGNNAVQEATPAVGVMSIEDEAKSIFDGPSSENSAEAALPALDAKEIKKESELKKSIEQEPLVKETHIVFDEKPVSKQVIVESVAEKKAVKPAVKEVMPSSIINPAPAETFTAGSNVMRISGGEGEDVPVPEEHGKVKMAARVKGKEKSFFSAMEEDKPSVQAEDATEDFPFPGEDEPSVSDLINEDYSKNDKKLFEVKKPVLSPNHSASGKPTEGEPLIPPSSPDGRVFSSTMPTTNGKIISSSDGRLEQGKPRNDTIYLLILCMFVFISIALFMTFFVDNNKKPDTNEQTVEEIAANKPDIMQPVVQGIDEGIISPAAPKKQPEQPQPTISEQEAAAVKAPALTHQGGVVVEKDNESAKLQAQNIVQRYMLDGGRGTIADYFNKTYSGTYQTRWTSSPLYGDTYIVEYFASKVRSEPIIYLFRVDVKRDKVTGALNNVTLDLISK